MREVIFRKILNNLEENPNHFLSQSMARLELQILLFATARGFRKQGKWILFSKDPLREYSSFSRKCLEECHQKEIRKSLYQRSYKLGKRIRTILGFRDPEDRKRLVFFLYRNIGITMTGSIPGEIQVLECYFSKGYTAEQCQWISAMDAGIIAGICGRGKLRFTERITQGCDQCKVHFILTDTHWM